MNLSVEKISVTLGASVTLDPAGVLCNVTTTATHC